MYANMTNTQKMGLNLVIASAVFIFTLVTMHLGVVA